jgi:type I restriction enzyme M protein
MAKRHVVGTSQRSVVARIEEIVLASSGADAFELVFSLALARLAGGRGSRAAIARGLKDAAKRWPMVEAARDLEGPGGSGGADHGPLGVSDDVLARVESLLDRAALAGDAEALDAVFEQLVTRVGKGEKGQFFTPRHVVDWIVSAAAPKRGERVLDPACGSGAFLAHARGRADVEAWGYDVDQRAVRVARLLAIASGGDPARIVRGDSLARGPETSREVDVITTNPPFAGDAAYEGFHLTSLGRRAERDALFVERCIELLRPGGRLAIVLPHNKVAARAWSVLRRWLVERAHVLAVVSLPRETFLPHTSQMAAVVFAKKRARAVRFEDAPPGERTFFAVSERAGKDAAGEPVFRRGVAKGEGTWRELDHDLDAIGGALAEHLEREGFAS